MNAFVAILVLIIFCLTLTIHFQSKIIKELNALLKGVPKSDVQKSKKPTVPDIMGVSKRQEMTPSDSERQKIKTIDSSVTFALKSENKEAMPPDENDNLDFQSDEFEELDPLELKETMTSEEMDEVNAMFDDAVVVSRGSILHKEVNTLNRFLINTDSNPEKENEAFTTFTKIEGTDFAKKMLAAYAPKSKELLQKWQQRIYAQEKEVKEEKANPPAEENKVFDIYEYL